MEFYNYNNEELLNLDNEDLINNLSTVESIYKDYETLEGEVKIVKSIPALFINGYFVARVKNVITKPQKLSFLQINNGKISAFLKKSNFNN